MDINVIQDEIDKQQFASVEQIGMFFNMLSTSFDIGAFFVYYDGQNEYGNDVFKLKSIRNDKFAPHNLINC